MTKVTRSRGNVFADIGLPDAETHQLKAELVRRIGLQIEASRMTPIAAAASMAMAQADVPTMLKGQFRLVPLEKLMRCLVALGQSVIIDIRQPDGNKAQPSISVLPERPVKKRARTTRR